MVQHLLNGGEVFSVDREMTGGRSSEIMESYIVESALFPQSSPGFLDTGATPGVAMLTMEHPFPLPWGVCQSVECLARQRDDMPVSVFGSWFCPSACFEIDVRPFHGACF